MSFGKSTQPVLAPLPESERLLPAANIARIMSREMPKSAKISGEARRLMQEIASEYICFITSEANDHSISQGRRSITANDLIQASGDLDLGMMQGAMRQFMLVRQQRIVESTPNGGSKSAAGSTSSSPSGPFKRPYDIGATSAGKRNKATDE
jgi:histone H3/H4